MVPPFVHRQEAIESLFLEKITDRKTRLLLRRSLRGSGIKTRHSVCESFFSNELFDEDGKASTGMRNEVYARESRVLAKNLGRKLLETTPGGLEAAEITHVVFATCTGFTNPGPDFHLIEDLGLKPTVQRVILGFMGCYSAVPALRTARQICEAEPGANVLVIGLELCSLHLNFDPTYDSVLANSLFADGAGAALVRSREPHPEATRSARLDRFLTGIIPEGEPDMDWRIGDQGFKLILSNRVPDLLESELGNFVRSNFEPDSVDHWAIHPGGRGILDKAESSIGLSPDKLAIPRRVMERYGNMAGATVFFVLRDMLEAAKDGENLLTLAFGPGLTVEAGLMKKV